jgi:hypothetical protein
MPYNPSPLYPQLALFWEYREQWYVRNRLADPPQLADVLAFQPNQLGGTAPKAPTLASILSELATVPPSSE